MLSEASFDPMRESVYVRTVAVDEDAANVTFMTLKLKRGCGTIRSAIPFVPPDATVTLVVAPMVDASVLYPGIAVVSTSAYEEPIESGKLDTALDGVNVGDTDPVDVPEGDEPEVGDGVPDGEFDGVTDGEIVRDLDVVPDAVRDVVGDTDDVTVPDGVDESDDPADGVCVPDGVGDGDGATIPIT